MDAWDVFTQILEREVRFRLPIDFAREMDISRAMSHLSFARPLSLSRSLRSTRSRRMPVIDDKGNFQIDVSAKKFGSSLTAIFSVPRLENDALLSTTSPHAYIFSPNTCTPKTGAEILVAPLS